MDGFLTVLIIILIIYLWSSRINQIKERNVIDGKNAINKLIDSGEWVKGPGGQPMPRERALYLEKVNHPDYIYSVNRRVRTEIQLSYMSLSEIIEVAKLHRENEVMKNNEKEEKSKRQAEERRRWRNPINHFEFEINECNGRQAGVYIIYNHTTKDYYVGSSVDMYKRKLQHLRGLRNNNHPSRKLQRSFREFGEDSFRFYALKLVDFEEVIKKPGFRYISDLTNEGKKEILENMEQEMLNRFHPELNGYIDLQHWKRDSRKFFKNF